MFSIIMETSAEAAPSFAHKLCSMLPPKEVFFLTVPTLHNTGKLCQVSAYFLQPPHITAVTNRSIIHHSLLYISAPVVGSVWNEGPKVVPKVRHMNIITILSCTKSCGLETNSYRPSRVCMRAVEEESMVKAGEAQPGLARLMHEARALSGGMV